jgi:AraC family transcriptional regulator, transcriptional activator FtrA
MKNHLVAALAHPPLSSFEFSCTAEVFGSRAPTEHVRWYEFAVGAIAPGPVPSTGGVEVYVRHGLEIFEQADTIVVPSWPPDREPPAELIAMLKAAHARGARLVAICSGVFIVAAAGLLDGRRIAAHWSYADELSRRHPEVVVESDVLYIDDGDIVTGAGSSAGLDMLLHIVRRDHGTRICNMVARGLIAPPHRDGGQSQIVERPVPRGSDTRLAKVLDYLRRNATTPLKTEQLAAIASMSPSYFNRKFRQTMGTSPYHWLLHERVAIARELLEESTLSIDQIGVEAGFGSTMSFRTNFVNIVGLKPASYRRIHRAGGSIGERRERTERAPVGQRRQKGPTALSRS